MAESKKWIRPRSMIVRLATCSLARYQPNVAYRQILLELFVRLRIAAVGITIG